MIVTFWYSAVSKQLLLTMVVLLSAFQPSPAEAQRARKAVLVIVDGIPADVIEKLSPPVLHDIAKAGGYSRAFVGGYKGSYSETPTISAVGYNSILTGTWVNKHNVWDNDIARPNYRYPTIFRYLKEQYPEKKTAIFSTWLDNRTKLVGDNLRETGNIPVDHHYDGLELDTVRFPHDKAGQYLDIIDDSVTAHAADYIRTDAPDLSWVYIEFTDDMGHAHGDGPEFTRAILDADKRIGRIWDAIGFRAANFKEDWLIIVTTDHGRDAKTGSGHGGQSDRERSGWIFTNAKDLNSQFSVPLLSIVDILPTMSRFLNIRMSKARAYEIDGTPFTGKISFLQPLVSVVNNKIQVTWKPAESAARESINIWRADSNHFKEGRKDNYRLIKKISLQSGRTSIPNVPGFQKIVLEGKNNVTNLWVGK